MLKEGMKIKKVRKMKEQLFKSVPWHFSELWNGCDCSLAPKCVDTALSLQNLFVGPTIEGKGKFVNLAKIKTIILKS